MPPLPIGIGPYADTLCRLDGGIDHKIWLKKFLIDQRIVFLFSNNGSTK